MKDLQYNLRMLQVSHQPTNLGGNFHEPRCPPTAPPSSPVLRQQIVRMIKNITQTPKAKVGTSNDQSSVRQWGETRQHHESLWKGSQSPSRAIYHGANHRDAIDANRKSANANKPVAEKQNCSLPIGNIRRLPLRLQRQATNLSTGSHTAGVKSKTDQENKENLKNSSCEVKGHAIQANGYIKAQKQRIDLQRRAQKLSASISDFKKRLMKSRNKVHPNDGDPGDKYTICATKPSRATTPLNPSNSQTPRTPLTRRSPIDVKQSPVQTSQQLSRADSRINTDPSAKVTLRYSSRDNAKQIHPVETYVLVENQQSRIRGKFDEPIALTMHNLSMHDMFIGMDEKRRGNGQSATTRRICKWLDNVESSVTRPLRTVRFNMANNSSSSSAEGSFSDFSF